ncbi:putative ferric-chelate reductase 1 [Actinia tenebrosa]|uniref:Ferric-chelate reductase 1 n=1 Tax=Actinia tenebrosa TaxID=6105 RepID=A0A6P8HD03_ACTTE|nr:putative ferric-chelate reductase 1 [Actinia tenebrosa]
MAFQRIYYFAVLAILCAGSRSFKISKSGCDKTKGCISFPPSCHSSDDCDYLVTFTPGDETVAFEMSARDDYIGFGLNKEQAMSGTDAIVCSKTSSGGVLVGHYLLPNHRTPKISKPTPSGLTNMSGEYKNGIIECRFHRSIKAIPPLKYDLNKAYYLIYARGPTSDTGELKYHDWFRFSPDRHNLTSEGPVDEASSLLVPLHAGLMFLAWVGFASIGMFTARNTRKVLEGELCCGMKDWFQVHRTLMTFATLITISGFVVIFIYKGGLSIETAGCHGIIGIIVVSLATLQPIIAFFRPSKESKRRYIFKWLHRCIAIVVFILAMTNCYLGLHLVDLPMTTHQGSYLLLGFVTSYMTVSLLCEVYSILGNTKEKDTSLLSAEVNSITGSVENSTEKDTKGKDSVLLLAYSLVVLLAVGVSTAFVIILFLSVRKWERS